MTDTAGKTISDPVVVAFEHSQRRAVWTYYDGSLRDLAERCVVPVPRDCGSGDCGQCRARVEGTVEQVRAPGVEVPEGEVLLCCCQPRGKEVRVFL